jgi:uncharacterized membrane protein YgcG
MDKSRLGRRTPIAGSTDVAGPAAMPPVTRWSRRDLLRFAISSTLLGGLPGCAFTRTSRLGYGEAGLRQIPAGRYTVTLFEPPARGLDAKFVYILTPTGQGKTDLDQPHGVRALGDKSLDEILALVKAQPLKSMEVPTVEAVVHHSGKIAGYLISHAMDCTVQVSDRGDLAVSAKESSGGGSGGGSGGAGGEGGGKGGGNL